MSDGIGVGGVISCLREKKSLWLIAAALVLGVCLMLFGGMETFGEGGTASLEARVEELCERVNGVSDVSVMITFTADGETVRGAAVVCTGGDDAAIRLTLTELLCALFGVPSSNVSVVGGK